MEARSVCARMSWVFNSVTCWAVTWSLRVSNNPFWRRYSSVARSDASTFSRSSAIRPSSHSVAVSVAWTRRIICCSM